MCDGRSGTRITQLAFAIQIRAERAIGRGHHRGQSGDCVTWRLQLRCDKLSHERLHTSGQILGVGHVDLRARNDFPGSVIQRGEQRKPRARAYNTSNHVSACTQALRQRSCSSGVDGGCVSRARRTDARVGIDAAQQSRCVERRCQQIDHPLAQVFKVAPAAYRKGEHRDCWKRIRTAHDFDRRCVGTRTTIALHQNHRERE